MSAIASHRWQRASLHLDRALELPPPKREACVASLRVEDPDTAAAVEALLAERAARGALHRVGTSATSRRLPLTTTRTRRRTITLRAGRRN